MAINELIARGSNPIQFESPVNRLAKVLQIQGAQQNIARGEMEQDQYRTTKARSNRLLELNRELGDVTDDVRSMAYKKEGYLSEADALEKGALERRKIGSTADKDDMETTLKHVASWNDILGKATNPAQAERYLQLMYADKRMANTPFAQVPMQEMVAHLQATPFEEWKKMAALGARDYIEKNKPTYQTTDLGGTKPTLALPGLGGAPTVVNTGIVTQSPDNAASNARQSAEGAANRAVQMRGQTLADFRARDLNENSREANRIAQDNKPLTEGQSKSALFGARMQEANDILDTLAKGGTEKSTPGMNAGYGVGTLVSGLSSNDQQQLMQAKRNFVNAVLRRESGAVIADSEFANAEKQYFPQIGDTPQVIEQKKANREAATRGVLIDVPESRRERIVSDIRGPKAKQQDMQALEWANANPNDPRAAKIKQRLGQ